MSQEKLEIAKGFKKAKKITKKNAKSFYFASFFLGRSQKKSAYSIYAICRISDDSVDENNNGKLSLGRIKEKIDLAYSKNSLRQPLLLSFQKTINKFKIPKKPFKQLIKAMEMDLEKKSYQSWPELYDYCYKAAGVIGLIMLYIFSFKKEEAKKYAVSLGIAMQLTNILRDIKEDYRRGRVYLPQDELKKFKVNPDCFQKEKTDTPFIDLMKFQIKRAKKYYCQSEKGVKLISGRRNRLTVCLMKNIYQAILDEIEKNNYNIFQKRARTSFFNKICLSLKTIIKLKYL